MTRVNYEKHADALAEALQEFVWIHSGSDSGLGLQYAFKAALRALMEYRKEAEAVSEKPLKRVLQDAYWEAAPDIQIADPWTAVLEALADRAKDWEKYASESGSTTDDIRDWLRAEAAK